MGDATRGEEAIVLALKTPRNSDERIWLGDYGSPLRDNALMLSLLEENKLLPDEQYTLLNTLSQQAFGERWLSTQESNALFLAARTIQDLPGKWQAQTSFSAEPLTGEKTLNSNLNSDLVCHLAGEKQWRSAVMVAYGCQRLSAIRTFTGEQCAANRASYSWY
ncbi:hypothetical protein ACLB1M_19915 [Escherichia coli]